MIFFPVSKEEHYYIKLTLFSDFRGLKNPIYLTRTALFFEKVVILTVQKQTEISGFPSIFFRPVPAYYIAIRNIYPLNTNLYFYISLIFPSNSKLYIKSEFIISAFIKIYILGDITACRLLISYRRFGDYFFPQRR